MTLERDVRDRVRHYVTIHRQGGERMLPTMRRIALEYEALRHAHEIDQGVIRELCGHQHRSERVLNGQWREAAVSIVRAVVPGITDKELRKLMDRT